MLSHNSALRTLRHRRDRGMVTLLAFSGLAFVLAMLCGTVLFRSMDAYRATAVLENRLRAQAAAEGAVVAILATKDKKPESPLAIGTCMVAFEPASADGATSNVALKVEVYRDAGRPALPLNYTARFQGANGTPKFDGLELRP